MTRRLRLEVLEDRRMLSSEPSLANSLLADAFERQFTDSPSFDPSESLSNSEVSELHEVTRSIIPNEFVIGIRQDTEWVDALESFAFDLTTSLGALGNLSFADVLSLTDPNDQALSVVHVSYDGETSLDEMLAFAASATNVSWAAPNYQYSGALLDFVPDDPLFVDQYHHTLMGNPVAWDITLGDSDVVIAITDQGVERSHPDLAPNIWENTAEVRGVAGVDDDGNGFIDDFNGWDFVSNDNDPDPLISNDDHGTHVAGIAAGVTNNSNQIAGTAGNASIMPLRISGADGGFTSVIMANAFAYAIDNGARIANTSYNINGFVGDPTFTAGLQYFYDNGGLHFNSAGNSDQLNPARQAFHQTLLVASTTSSDEKSGFSNYGSGIDIAAPGSSILSTETNGGTGTKSGTSMAAPNAAGAAALIWSANPEYSRDQVAAQLLGTADNIDGVNPAYIGLLGTGRVNTGRALTETLPAPTILSLNGLPDEGAVGKVGSSFELRFDQVMDPGSIAPGSFDLRNAGANGVFGDSDDIVYGLSHDDYLIGTNSLVFEILGSPLQRGSYRLTASSEVLQNPFQTALDGDGDGVGGDNFVRSFGIPPTVTVDPLLTNDTAPALTGTVDDPTATIVVEVAGQAGLVAVNNGDGTWTLPDDTLAPLLDGSYDVLVSATDITSFTGVDSTTDELTIDTTLIRGLITDYFRGDSFDPLNWNSVAGATIDTVGIDEPSVPYAARFNGDPAGGDSIESVVLDLSSVLSTSIVELRYFFQQTGGGESPAVDEDLIVEFRDESLVWVELERQLGSGPDMTSFERSIVTLPTAALHASSQLRFRNTASPGVVDDWFVDNVELLELVAPAAPPTVTVNRLLTSDATPALTGTVDDPQATIIVDVAGQTGLSAINNGDGTWVLPDNTLAAVADGTYDVVVYATDSMFDTGVDGTLDELTVDSAFLRTRLAEFFPIAVFDPTNWAFVDNATIDTVGIGEPSPPHAARLSGGTMIETVALDLSNVASFELAYFFQRTGGGESPDLGDDLIVEYRDISSTWVELERQLGGGPDMSMFEQRIVALPPAALHANSQMRFRNAANASAFDDWFLDDIELLEFIDEDAPVVTIDFLVTSDRMPALTGTVDDPSAVIVVDVAQQIGLAAINNGDGTWMLPANTLDSLMDGTYEVVVTATDLSLNAAADESTNELTIDNLAPVVTVDPLLTSDPTPMLTGSVDDHDATILVSVAGQAGVAATNNGDGTWTLPNGLLGPFVSGTYDVMVTATDAANNVGVDESTDELTIDTGSLVTIYAANMTVDPGWTFSVPGANKWAWGIPLGLDGDPDSGFSGSNVIGYNLSGQYASSLSEEYATTPPIDMRGHTNVSLSFWRWLGIEQARWDQAAIEVSNNGADWTTVWRHSGNDLVDTNWKLQEYDISGVADNQQSVQLRWVMGETDSFGNFAGWNIDDVVIQGVQIDLPPAVTIDALITSDPTPALTGTVDDPAASILVDVAGQTGLAAINHGDGTWTLPDDTLAELANGTYDVTVTAIDAGSNVGVDATTDELTIDSSFMRTLLSERFPTTAFDPSNWSLVEDAMIDTVGIDEPSAPYAARFNGAPAGGDSIESVALDLSQIGRVELSYFFQRTGRGNAPEPGDDLIVEYRDTSSTWVELERQLGSGPSMNLFEQNRITLPSPALHSNAQVRFRNTANVGAFDDWFVDDIQLLAFVDNDPPLVTVDFLVTNDRTPALTGTVDDPTASIRVDVAGQSGLKALNNGDGTWTLPDNTLDTLLDGTYEVVVTATDRSLNSGVDATTDELTIDNLSPVVTIDPLVTFRLRPSLSGTVDDSAATIFVSVVGQPSVMAINNKDGTWTLPENTLAPLTEGTYDVGVTATDGASNVGDDITTDELTVDTSLLRTIYAANMTVDPGWIFSVPGPERWAYGTPLGSGGDPSSGFTGSHVIGYNLSGQYANSLSEEYATTPPIDMRGYSNVSLSFWRWLGIEQSMWDQAAVEVSNNGTEWTTVWRHSGGIITDVSWMLQEYDISAVADNQPSVQVRWVMGATDTGVTFAGWNIDDVLMQGIQSPDCDFSDDGMCDIQDIDQLVAQIAAGNDNQAFDLTGDGRVDLFDRDQWLEAAGAANLPSMNPYLVGDANLDGAVDGQDFLLWNTSKFNATAKWSQGDWNADGITDGQDFLIWNENKFQSRLLPVVFPDPLRFQGPLALRRIDSVLAKPGQYDSTGDRHWADPFHGIRVNRWDW